MIQKLDKNGNSSIDNANVVILDKNGNVKTPGGAAPFLGTINTLPKFLTPTTLGDSQIVDNGTNVTVGGGFNFYKFNVNGEILCKTNLFLIGDSGDIQGYADSGSSIGSIGFNKFVGANFGTRAFLPLYFFTNYLIAMTITTNQNVLIGTTIDTGEKLQVEGDSLIKGSLNNGTGCVASGVCSHAEGANTISSGVYSHAEGQFSLASGYFSHAEGSNTIASGYYSHAEGIQTTASGVSTHAEGQETIASGELSHAEGNNTVAEGVGSHTEGVSTRALGEYSHAEGNNTIAQGNFQHVQGQCNTPITDEGAFIIGNGTDDLHRSNLVEAYGDTFKIYGSLVLNNVDIESAWIPYTPTWEDGTSTPPNIGNGFISATYKKIGKTVFFRMMISTGTTTTYGTATGTTAAWSFSLPYPTTTSFVNIIPFSANIYGPGHDKQIATSCTIDRYSFSIDAIDFDNLRARSIMKDFPWVWGTPGDGSGSIISVNGTYECA